MTRENAIKIFNTVLCLGKCDCPKDEIEECLKMAIEALKTQPSEDCIRRSDVSLTNLEILMCNGDYKEALKMLLDKIEKAPSVNLQPKVGHWIEPQQDDGMSDPIYYQVRCSECNFDLDPQTWSQELHQYGADKYCPRCGCRMQEVKK